MSLAKGWNVTDPGASVTDQGAVSALALAKAHLAKKGVRKRRIKKIQSVLLIS